MASRPSIRRSRQKQVVIWICHEALGSARQGVEMKVALELREQFAKDVEVVVVDVSSSSLDEAKQKISDTLNNGVQKVDVGVEWTVAIVLELGSPDTIDDDMWLLRTTSALCEEEYQFGRRPKSTKHTKKYHPKDWIKCIVLANEAHGFHQGGFPSVVDPSTLYFRASIGPQTPPSPTAASTGDIPPAAPPPLASSSSEEPVEKKKLSGVCFLNKQALCKLWRKESKDHIVLTSSPHECATALNKACPVWSWRDEHRTWRPYPAYVNAGLESAYREGRGSHRWFDKYTRCERECNFLQMTQYRLENQMLQRLVHRDPPVLEARIPEHLLSEVKSGNCVVFLGAGFTAPAKGPSWAQLLKAVCGSGINLLLGRPDEQLQRRLRAGAPPPDLPAVEEEKDEVVDDNKADSTGKSATDVLPTRSSVAAAAARVGQSILARARSGPNEEKTTTGTTSVSGGKDSDDSPAASAAPPTSSTTPSTAIANNTPTSSVAPAAAPALAWMDDADDPPPLASDDSVFHPMSLPALQLQRANSATKYGSYGGYGALVGKPGKKRNPADFARRLQQLISKRRAELESQVGGLEALEEHLQLLSDNIQKLTRWGANHTEYEQAAQMLADEFNDGILTRLVCLELSEVTRETILDNPDLYAVMASRLRYLKNIPFSALITTNYNLMVCSCKDDYLCTCVGKTPLSRDPHSLPPYREILRARPPSDTYFISMRPVVQIHGSVLEPDTIVLSKEGYRKLLNSSPGYVYFLRSLMATKTILYVGFSFNDDYLNELRSSVMSLVRYGKDSDQKNLEPLAYAIINDKTQEECDYYLEHEGVQMLTWDSDEHGYGGCDRYLVEILRQTSPAYTIANTLKRVAILLARQSDNLFACHNDFVVKEWEAVKQLLLEVGTLAITQTGDSLKAVQVVNMNRLTIDELDSKPEEELRTHGTGMWVAIFPAISTTVSEVGDEIAEDLLAFTDAMRIHRCTKGLFIVLSSVKAAGHRAKDTVEVRFCTSKEDVLKTLLQYHSAYIERQRERKDGFRRRETWGRGGARGRGGRGRGRGRGGVGRGRRPQQN